ncbi:hypothetical protein Tco_0659451, partial [Tanacetum coccineum]
SDNVPATVATMTALSSTFASTSSILPITIDDYEIARKMLRETFREMFREMLLPFPRLILKRKS